MASHVVCTSLQIDGDFTSGANHEGIGICAYEALVCGSGTEPNTLSVFTDFADGNQRFCDFVSYLKGEFLYGPGRGQAFGGLFSDVCDGFPSTGAVTFTDFFAL